MALNWINDQPAQFYDQLAATQAPVLAALDVALGIIENAPHSPQPRPRCISAVISPPPLWLVDVRHDSGDLQILWQEDDRGEPMLIWIGPARFPRM
ncbi:MAG TPA: hypothetical protein VFQ37_08695 [Mycobacterium sp.]|nr:hypothetical protein [Mycobacterium sp.]